MWANNATKISKKFDRDMTQIFEFHKIVYFKTLLIMFKLCEP